MLKDKWPLIEKESGIDLQIFKVEYHHYKNPRNKGLKQGPEYKTIHIKNPTCGDDITIQSKIEEGIVKDVRHDGTGCSICCSSASVMSETLTGKTVEDIDLFEINEAFSVVAEKFIRDLDLDRETVNVNGGAMALGHPIGATGSILIGTMVDELERQGKKRGLVTMCAAGGMAPAIIIERV